MPPKWSEFLLTTNIPHSKYHILILNFLHIETYKEDRVTSLSTSSQEEGIFNVAITVTATDPIAMYMPNSLEAF